MQKEQGISTDKLHIGYRKDLIRDITLCVEPGRIVTLIGPNGCGKTTLLKTLTGELSQRGGTVFLDGKDRALLSAAEIAKRVSVLMTYKINPRLMTCREVVEIGRYPYTGSFGLLSAEDKKIVQASMEWTDVAQLSEVQFDTLSDGQKQRVLLARAICQEPEVLILDEPTSYLDLRHKLELLSKLTAYVRKKNVAVLLSLHELDIAKNISDTVVALGEGQVLRIGPPEEVFTEDFIRKLYHIENMDTALLGSLPWEPGSGDGIGFEKDADACESEIVKQCEEQAESRTSVKENRAKAIMVQGTMSGAGKSLIAAGLCRIFSDDGYKVAPFKSQNMALNSFITKDGLEMGRAQVMQAECARTQPEAAMNPILLKPTGDTGSQVIIGGKAIGNMSAAQYYKRKKDFKIDIMQAYESLAKQYDIIVIEGAGSPVELNLKQDDIVNMGIAQMVDAPVLLVGDIDRGGVFAQLCGTMALLEKAEQSRVKGLIVNKFRGDRSLFSDGIRILEEKTRVKVAGVVPYLPVRLDEEDSLTDRFGEEKVKAFDVAVIKPAHISNFTDFEPFAQRSDVSVRYVSEVAKLGTPDLIILPGSKNTIADLRLLKENGLAGEIVRRAAEGVCIIGICGGYQMLGRKIKDPDGAECGGSEEGLCLLPVDTVLAREKTTRQAERTITDATGVLQSLAGSTVKGYEIHNGKTEPYEAAAEFVSEKSGYCRGNVYGTYLHGFFDQKEILTGVLEKLAKANNKTLADERIEDYAAFKESQYALLAKSLRESLDMQLVYKSMGIEHDI